MSRILISLLLLALASPVLRAQGAAAPQEAAADEGEGQEPAVDEAEPPPPPKRRAARRAAAPDRPDPVKRRLAEINRVYKNQVAFGASELDMWKSFWTKLRDERGLFEVRLAKQRDGFVESLRSLEAKDHGQSLLDFETMQGNVMRSFEDQQAARIRDFMAEREGKLREFGAAQETERARLAQDSEDAWIEEKSQLKIEVPVPSEKDAKKKKKN